MANKFATFDANFPYCAALQKLLHALIRLTETVVEQENAHRVLVSNNKPRNRAMRTLHWIPPAKRTEIPFIHN